MKLSTRLAIIVASAVIGLVVIASFALAILNSTIIEERKASLNLVLGMLTCVFTGFSSGLPLYVLISLLPAWLRSSGIDLKAIGLFALIQLPFTWKFLWSPLLDRFVPPFLGRRRGWMLLTQLCLLVSLGAFGGLDPHQNLWSIA